MNKPQEVLQPASHAYDTIMLVSESWVRDRLKQEDMLKFSRDKNLQKHASQLVHGVDFTMHVCTGMPCSQNKRLGTKVCTNNGPMLLARLSQSGIAVWSIVYHLRDSQATRDYPCGKLVLSEPQGSILYRCPLLEHRAVKCTAVASTPRNVNSRRVHHVCATKLE